MAACSACGAENRESARFCDSCGAALAPAAPERRKLATLLFCDLSGSTAMGERVDAESVRELMFRYFHEMRGAIERHGGTVEKFVGDAVMAVFGVPVAHEDDALRACRAAWEMRGRLDELNPELERRFGTTIALRIGLNTGEVVAGDASAGETFVSGDAVNLAARLEQHAATNEILVGESTFRLVRNAVKVEAASPIAAKGKAAPVACYRLVGVADGPVRRPDAQFLGRGPELERLLGLYAEAARDASCRTVAVIGEPGVGKSRLAEELVARVAADARVLRGRCLHYGDGVTYWPLREVLWDAVAVREETTSTQTRSRIAGLLGADADGDVAAEHLAAAVGISGAASTPEEIAWAARRLAAELARERPLVLVLDDLHWAEPVLLDLVEGLASVAAPLLVVALARRELLEQRPAWQERALVLDVLDGGTAAALAAARAGPASLPEDVTRRVVDAAGGNPLFVEEFVAMLIDEEVLRQADGAWETVGDLAATTVPATLESLLESRLDRLDERERGPLERGAVEGQVFHRGAVEALSDAAHRPGVTAALLALSERQLIRPDQSSFADDAAFRFRHILIRDAAYRMLPKRARAELHERFAEWLEERGRLELGEYDEFVGYHLEQAYLYLGELGPVGERERELGARAAAWLASAAQRSSTRGDMRAAANLLRRAANALPPMSRERGALLPQLAEALLDLGDFAVALEALDEAEATGDPDVKLRAQVPRRLVQSFTDPDLDTGPVRAEVREMIAALERASDDHALARAWRLVAYLDLSDGQGANMQEAIERAVEHARRAGDRREELEGLFLLPMLTWFGPMPRPQALERCEALLDEARGAQKVEAMTLTAIGLLNADAGDFATGRRLVARAAEMLDELGLTMWAAGWAQEVAGLELLAGDASAAEAALRPSCERLRELGETGIYSTNVALLAEAVYRLGRYDEALELAAESERAAPPGDLMSLGTLHSVRAKALSALGRLAEAEASARTAIEYSERSDFANLRTLAQLDLAEVLTAAAKEEEARAGLERALGIAEQKGNLVLAAEASRRLERLLESAV
jgi:class 3 adenylate cyclase/tetratricopeptide (TPR) repeat protein